MKKMLLITCSLALFWACTNKNNLTQTSQDTPLNTEVTNAKGDKKLLGVVNAAGLEKEPYSEWFSKKENYKPKAEIVEELESALNEKYILAFFGTWCGDSKRHLPEFYSVVEAAQFSPSNFKVVAVNTGREQYKQSPGGEEKGLNIHRVPTFIVYNKKGEELGRIVESPKESIEEDLLKIATGQEYLENYQIVAMLENKINLNGEDYIETNFENLVKAYKGRTESEYELNTYSYTKLFSGKRKLGKAITQLNHAIYFNDYTLEKAINPLIVDEELEKAWELISAFKLKYPESEAVAKLEPLVKQPR